MKRILLLSIPLALLAACGPVQKKGCKDTGCGAGSVCNTNTGACEIPGSGAGGGAMGGGTGGGSAGGTGGGAVGGGGGPDGGIDAGMVVIDPFDDGGVFVAGDICSYAIPVLFDGGMSADGGPSSLATVTVDLAAASNQYKAICNTSTGAGNDVVFAITLTEPRGLIVTTTDTSGKTQDAVLALISAPCPLLNQRACIDATSGGVDEILTVSQLAAGTWYVLLENWADDNLNDGTYDVSFELVAPVPGPPNDSCATAQPLTFTNGSAAVTGTTVNALNDTGAAALTCSAASALAADVFYSFTLTQPQNVTVTVDTPSTSNLFPAFALTDVCGAAGAGNERACRTGPGSTFQSRNLLAGTYYIVVDGDDSVTGAFTLNVTLTPGTPPPSNDTCNSPLPIAVNSSQMVDTNAGVLDYSYGCSTPSGGDLAYQFTTTAPQKVTIRATGIGTADAVISLRTACSDMLSELNCVDTTSNPEVLTMINLPAGTYYVLLAAYGALAGQFDLTVDLAPPVLPPVNETCAMPEVVVLTGGMATRNIDLTAASADIASDLCATLSDGADVTYEVAIPAGQTLTVVATPVGLFVNPVLFARQPVCSMAVSIACVDNGFGGDPETLVVPNTTVGPLTVYIIVKAADILDPGELNLTFTAM